MTPLEHHIQSRIATYIASDAAIIYFELDGDGTILNTNAYARKVVGGDPTGAPFESLIIDFQGSFDFQSCLQQGASNQLFNFSGHNSLPQTFYFNFFQIEGRVLALGQLDVEELDTLRHSLVSLNSELNSLTRQLEKQNVELQKLDAQKNQFFGMAAHDLRHPLGVIKMYSEFLADEAKENLSDEHTEFLDHIQKSSELMETILNDFIDIAVFETGKLSLNPRRIDLTAWLANIVEYSTVLAARKNVNIEMETERSLPQMTLDDAKMEQVINNLISNAIKYTNPGDRVQLTVCRKADQAVISVRDNGPGIEQKDLIRLFTPFERASHTQRTDEKSSGLGLAIVKKIVEAHGGKTWVESKPGHGSTFFVSLPLTYPHEPQEGHQ